MVFQRVYDMEQADKLWEAGLLWVRDADDSEWVVDDSYTILEMTAPSEDELPYQYAILLEE